MKRYLIIASGTLLLLVLIAVGAIFLLDVNRYKPFLEKTVHDYTGKHLVIGGDISLELFPSLRVVAENVWLENTKNDEASERLVVVDKILMDAQLLPLLKGKLEVDSITFLHPQLYVARLPSGTTNWQVDSAINKASVAALTRESGEEIEDMHAHEGEYDTAVPASMGDSEEELVVASGAIPAHVPAFLALPDIFTFRSIEVKGGQLRYRDLQQGREWVAKDINFSTALMSGKNPFSLAFTVEGMPEEHGKVALEGVYLMNGVELVLEKMKASVGQARLSGEIHTDFSLPIPKINAGLMADRLDIALYQDIVAALPGESGAAAEAASAEAEQPADTKPAALWNDKPLDFSWAQKVNGHVAVKVDELVLKNLTLRNIISHAHFQLGKVAAKIKEMEIAEGKISSELEVDTAVNVPTLKYTLKAEAVDLGALQQLAPAFGYIDGRATIEAELSSRGRTSQQLVDSLSGQGKLTVEEGSIRGLDFLNMARNIAAAFALQPEQKRTAFSSANASFKINKGVLQNDDLTMETPAFNFTGKGKIALADNRIDYRLDPAVQAESEIRLVPVLIRGDLQHPKFLPDIETVAKRFLENPSEGKDVVDKIKNNLNSLKENLGGGLQQLFQGF